MYVYEKKLFFLVNRCYQDPDQQAFYAPPSSTQNRSGDDEKSQSSLTAFVSLLFLLYAHYYCSFPLLKFHYLGLNQKKAPHSPLLFKLVLERTLAVRHIYHTCIIRLTFTRSCFSMLNNHQVLPFILHHLYLYVL